MAIKIQRGTAPQYGRITMPQGTFLSNPSTAPDGSLGGPSGTNPPTPQVNMWGNVTPGYNAPLPRDGQWYSPITNALTQVGNALAKTDTALRNTPNPLQSTFQPIVPQWMQDLTNIAESAGRPSAQTSTNVFSNPYQAGNKPGGGYGFDVPATPDAIPMRQIGSILSGMSDQEVQQVMKDKGYEMQYQYGVGPVWIRTGQSGDANQLNQAFSGGLDSRGRPQYVEGAALQPGERAISSSGVRYVGGTPTATGEGQYAITLPNEAAARDTKGRFKWVSDVRKDANGNWVRVYRQELRKVYTRSWRKNHAYSGGGGGQGAGAGQDNRTPGEYNQLVNLRANYG